MSTKITSDEYIRNLMPDFAVLVDLEERFVKAHLADTADPLDSASSYEGTSSSDSGSTKELMITLGGEYASTFDTGFYRVAVLSDKAPVLSGYDIVATYPYDGRYVTAGISEHKTISITNPGGGVLMTAFAF